MIRGTSLGYWDLDAAFVWEGGGSWLKVFSVVGR